MIPSRLPLTALSLLLVCLAGQAEENPAPTARAEIGFRKTAGGKGNAWEEKITCEMTLEVTAPWEEGKGWAKGTGTLRILKATYKGREPSKSGELKPFLDKPFTFELGVDGVLVTPPDLSALLRRPALKVRQVPNPEMVPLEPKEMPDLHSMPDCFVETLKECLSLAFLRADRLHRAIGSAGMFGCYEDTADLLEGEVAEKGGKAGDRDLLKRQCVLKRVYKGSFISDAAKEQIEQVKKDRNQPAYAELFTLNEPTLKEASGKGDLWLRQPEGILWKWKDQQKWVLTEPPAGRFRGDVMNFTGRRELEVKSLEVLPPE